MGALEAKIHKNNYINNYTGPKRFPCPATLELGLTLDECTRWECPGEAALPALVVGSARVPGALVLRVRELLPLITSPGDSVNNTTRTITVKARGGGGGGGG